MSRLARLAGRDPSGQPPILEPLLRTVRANNPREDFDLIQRALRWPSAATAGQKRKSGDPYITHPVAVATILAELGMTGTTLAAALLHDTVEDTAYTLDDLKQRVRPRGRHAGGRRHQAGQGPVRRGRAVGDRAQDGRGDGQGHPRPA